MSTLSRVGLMALVGLGTMTLASTASAQTDQIKDQALNRTDKKDKNLKTAPKNDEEKRAWSVGAGYGLRIGQGTFVDPAGSFADERGDGSNAFDRVMNVYSLNASYSFSEFSLSTGLAWTHWLTRGGGANEPNETRFQDMSLAMGWSGTTLGSSGIRLTADASLGFPTSDFSRATSQIVATGAGFNLSRRFFERLSVNFGLNGGKTFHQFNQPVADLSKAGDGNVLFRAGGAEQLGQNLVALGDRNVEYSLGGSVSAGISLMDGMRLGINYGYSTFWTYASAVDNDDEFRSLYGDAGRGRGDVVSTGVSLSYSFLEHFSVSGGIRTAVAPKTSDNQSFRFPFWNMQGAANNWSQLTFGLSANY